MVAAQRRDLRFFLASDANAIERRGPDAATKHEPDHFKKSQAAVNFQLNLLTRIIVFSPPIDGHVS